MGWFSRKKVKKSSSSSQAKPQKPQQVAQKPSFAAPPNVYTTRPAPPQQLPQHQLPQQRPPQQQQIPQQRPLPRPNFPYAHQYGAQSQPQFRPAGYLPAPSGWTPPVPTYQPVIVNHQHYYLGGQQQPQPQHHAPPAPMQPTQPSQNLQPPQQHVYPQQHTTLGRFTGSMVNLTKDIVPAIPQLYDDGLAAWHGCTQIANSTAAVYDQVYSRFNNVMTLIDHEKCVGTENDLFHCSSSPMPSPQSSPDSISPPTQDRGIDFLSSKPKKSLKPKKSQATCATAVVSGNYFSKVEYYANSKLPRDLPPLALYMPTWPILCLAAQYSQRVYDKPTGAELDAHVSGDWLTGTKAMCIKSVPMDDMNTIVFAIRGTASFMDWAVNLNTAPVSPHKFLDDPGNLCHAGFLTVAKKMVRPVAARLRQLLREDPSRSRYSLLITGHSAGGAVAALLYSHMLADTKEAESELNILTNCFKRIHCVTFGTPPVSLLPLTKPDRPNLRKSLFLSFVNEGDPVVRADKAYIKSLIDLLTTPVPILSFPKQKDQRGRKSSSDNRRSRSKSTSKANSRSTSPSRPRWKVPPCTLSNAGRLVVLRSGDPKARPKDRKTVRERLNEGVLAATCQEEQLRSVIWGDPVCHLMSLYAGRIEVLAVGSVTGKGR